jgi:hypothetical protein
VEAGFISFLPQELRDKMPSRSPVNDHCLRLLAVCRIVRVATNKLSSGVLSLLIGGSRLAVEAIHRIPNSQPEPGHRSARSTRFRAHSSARVGVELMRKPTRRRL